MFQQGTAFDLHLQLTLNLEFPRGAPHTTLVWTNTQRRTGLGGPKIGWPSGSGNPREKEARWQMVKPRLGIAEKL